MVEKSDLTAMVARYFESKRVKKFNYGLPEEGLKWTETLEITKKEYTLCFSRKLECHLKF